MTFRWRFRKRRTPSRPESSATKGAARMLLIVAAVVALALLSKGASGSASTPSGTNPNTPAPKDNAADVAKTTVGVVAAVAPLVTAIAAAWPTASAGTAAL